VLPAVRSERERAEAHPVYRAFMQEPVSRAFSRDEVRATVIPAYMGLVKQIDDHIGRLLRFLEAQDLLERTMVVFTSDHGDYLGDHWLGEKELFHDASARIPLIVYDPRPEADATRGTACDALVEAIDLAPTFVELCGGEPRPHVLEGRSLAPLLHGRPGEWRRFVVSEYDYAMRRARVELGVPIRDAHMTMLFDGRWKYVLAHGFRDMLFDLENDPAELNDLGADPAHAGVRRRLRDQLLDWALRHHNRITVSDERIENTWDKEEALGILIGRWSE
jgi:arylsulfatase A-like enzyme